MGGLTPPIIRVGLTQNTTRPSVHPAKETSDVSDGRVARGIMLHNGIAVTVNTSNNTSFLFPKISYSFVNSSSSSSVISFSETSIHNLPTAVTSETQHSAIRRLAVSNRRLDGGPTANNDGTAGECFTSAVWTAIRQRLACWPGSVECHGAPPPHQQPLHVPAEDALKTSPEPSPPPRSVLEAPPGMRKAGIRVCCRPKSIRSRASENTKQHVKAALLCTTTPQCGAGWLRS